MAILSHSCRILIVEDEAILAMNLQDKLLDLGYEVPATAESGKQALELVDQVRPDLVLMDIKLKDGMDGLEAARLIHLKYQDIPIIFMTAYGDEHTIQRAIASGSQGFLMKPFQPSQLNRMLVSALQNPIQ
jgi:CheY-like chemotaxis protein